MRRAGRDDEEVAYSD